MTNQEVMIDLDQYRSPGVHVFSGRERGLAVREAISIDRLCDEYEYITIIVPEDVYSINLSFLSTFLSGVVSKIGKDEFYRKFRFVNNGRWKINTSLESAIERILRTPEYDWYLPKQAPNAKIATGNGLECLSSATPQMPNAEDLKLWMEVFEPPFKFDASCGTTIFDKNNNMVCQVRGWGRISYYENAEKRQDAFGHWLAKQITGLYEKH